MGRSAGRQCGAADGVGIGGVVRSQVVTKGTFFSQVFVWWRTACILASEPGLAMAMPVIYSLPGGFMAVDLFWYFRHGTGIAAVARTWFGLWIW